MFLRPSKYNLVIKTHLSYFYDYIVIFVSSFNMLEESYPINILNSWSINVTHARVLRSCWTLWLAAVAQVKATVRYWDYRFYIFYYTSCFVFFTIWRSCNNFYSIQCSEVFRILKSFELIKGFRNGVNQLFQMVLLSLSIELSIFICTLYVNGRA